ncbi:MAG: DMT family transporter [Acidovorax sp.]|jgi:drug/metabolite transporter (DMT)-like permease|nr:DMT family transporter [Acidovorax sp.]
MSIRNALPALAAAALFGASTPFAKLLVGDVPPLLLAGLLYLGSGIGLSLLLGLRSLQAKTAPDQASMRIPKAQWPWLLGAVVFGGVLGPAFLMLGLTQTGSAMASLLLNVEGVFTALMAWLVFKENADLRIVLGMLAIVAGGLLLSWAPGATRFSAGALLVVAACLCWAVDNNLTRKVSSHDAMLIAAIKGLLAGISNTVLAWIAGASLPAAATMAASMAVGFLGYGLSLTLFVLALRTLGTARTGAYFSIAPLFGVVISLLIWPSLPGPLFWLAAALMALGIWLHLQERHVHEHTHEPLEHSHRHVHDAHHQHSHDFAWDGVEPHSHPHAHHALTHSHAHYPDIHHQHRHS